MGLVWSVGTNRHETVKIAGFPTGFEKGFEVSDKTHVFLTGLVAMLAVSATAAGLIWPDLGAWFATENGPVETTSVIVWFVAGACLLLMHRPSPGVALALAVICANLAVREQGIPPEVIPSGKALMQLSHYFDPAVHWSRRLGEAVAVLGTLVAGVVGVWHLFLFMWRRQGWRTPVGRLLIGSFATLAISQVMDHWLGEDVLFEEILECVGALLVLVAVQALHQRQVEAAAACAGRGPAELPETCSRTL